MVAPQLQIQVRELCPHCYGAGRLGVATPYCGRCHRDFTAAIIATMVRQVADRRWRTQYRSQKRLPCRHRIAYLRWTDPTCSHCDGQVRWVPFDWALALDLNYVDAWVGKGVPLHYLKRYEEALVAYDRALSLAPNYALAWHNKASALRALGRTSEAEAAEQRAKALGWKG